MHNSKFTNTLVTIYGTARGAMLNFVWKNCYTVANCCLQARHTRSHVNLINTVSGFEVNIYAVNLTTRLCSVANLDVNTFLRILYCNPRVSEMHFPCTFVHLENLLFNRVIQKFIFSYFHFFVIELLFFKKPFHFLSKKRKNKMLSNERKKC